MKEKSKPEQSNIKQSRNRISKSKMITKSKKISKNKTKLKNETKLKNKKNNVTTIVISIIAVLIIALAIIFWRDIFPKENVVVLDEMYNGYIFYQEPALGLWSVTFKSMQGDMQSEFYYHPQELEDLPFDENVTLAFNKINQRRGKVFLSYDVNYSNSGLAAIAGVEIAKITGRVFLLETKSGFTEDLFNGTLPIYTCENASSTIFVFQILNGDENKVELVNNCAIITSKSPEDAVKLADLTVYHLLKIMPAKSVINR